MSKKLDEFLSQRKRKKDTQNGSSVNNDSLNISGQNTELQKIEDIKGVVIAGYEERKQLNLIDKMRANRLQSYKQLQAQEIIFDTQISQLKDQSEAIRRQSKAYWDTKSVDFAEGLKTYAQQNMAALENARLENKNSAIIDAYEIAYRKMDEILDKPYPDEFKEELISRILEARDNTIKRINENTLAERYGLGPSDNNTD